MPSPFPGIDPYLESQDLWPDFHFGFIAALRDAGYPAEAVRAYLEELDLPRRDVHFDRARMNVRAHTAFGLSGWLRWIA